MAETQAPSLPDPATMVGPIPYLAFLGQGNAALDFYARAFGATRITRIPLPDAPDRLMHGQCLINGGAFMLTDHMTPDDTAARPGLTGHLQPVVADGQAWFDRAAAAGCTVVSPFAAQFWGDHWGLLRDPFGIHWAVLQPAGA